MSHLTSSLMISLALLPAISAAKTRTDLNTPIGADVPAAALALVKQHAASFGARAPELRVRLVTPLAGGQVVRIAQLHHGLPVLGAEVSVLILRGAVRALAGELRELGALEAPRRERLLTATQASAALERQLASAHTRRATLAVWAPERAPAQWVWQLDARTARPFGLWMTLLDARTGQILWGRSAMRSAKGRVYTINPTAGKLVETPLLGLSKEEKQLVGEHADVQRCSAPTSTTLECDRQAVPDEDGDFLFKLDEPSLKDPFSEVQAYYHVDTFHRWLKATFGFARPGQQQIRVVVNFATKNYQGQMAGYANAFFGDLDGDGHGDLVLGQDTRDYAYDAGVIDHEFSHSVIDQLAGLDPIIDSQGFNLMPLGLNEGFADLLSCIFLRDPVVAEYIGGKSGNGLRTLLGMATCPDGLTGESHSDGLIWGRANWAIRSQLGDKELYAQVLYKTLAALDTHAGFADATAMLLAVAQVEYPAAVPVIQAEAKLRGLTGCSRIVPLPPDTQRSGYLYGTATVVGLLVVPGPLQYKIDVPQNALSIAITLTGGQHWGKVGAYLRRGEPVTYQGVKAIYDRVKPSTMDVVSYSTDGVGEELLTPGDAYYVLPANEGSYETMYKISYTLTLGQPAPDAAVPLPDTSGLRRDAGSSPADAVGLDAPHMQSGCSCSVHDAGSSAGAPLAAIALALLLARARGRRRRR
jgi:MYXO-CTERM domain-containing protein